VGRYLHRLVTLLCKQVAHLHFWAANSQMVNRDIPSQLEHTVLTKSLRYSPSIFRCLRPLFNDYRRRGLAGPDDNSGIFEIPSAGEGTKNIILLHQGEGHTGPYPMDCEQCGRNVGVKLRQIGVGPQG
jgi:hypothetical protein